MKISNSLRISISMQNVSITYQLYFQFLLSKLKGRFGCAILISEIGINIFN